MAVTIAHQASLKLQLEKGKFTGLTPEDWSMFLKTWAKEEGDLPASYETDFLNTSVQWVFSNLLGPFAPQQNTDGFMEGAVFLKNDLPTSARIQLCAGLDLWVRECLDLLASGHPDALKILRCALEFEGVFEGAISGVLAEEIVLNPQIDAQSRIWIALHLNQRSYPLSVSRLCWKTLQAQIPEIQAFAGPVMEWLVEHGRDLEALEIPLLLTPEEDDPIQLLRIVNGLVLALQQVPGYSEWKTLLRELFARYPPWAVTLLKEDVIPRLNSYNVFEDLRMLIPE